MTYLSDLIVHLEGQMDAVTLEVMLFALVDESLNVLALRLARVSRTLVDIDIGVVSCSG